MLSVRLTLISLLVLPLASSLRAAPVVSAQIADFTVYDATPANEIDLTTKFSDPTLSANTVRLETVLGDIDVVLFDQKTPITVDNFLRYIDSGAYYPTDLVTGDPAPLFFHRSPDPDDFVIQSGGYAATQDPLDPPFIFPTAVTQFDPIENEARPDLHNVRGTISMAKLPNDPDSATSQWFINLVDNSGPPSSLDTTNGGFTVFGQVTTPSLAVIDAISDVPTYDASGVITYGSAFSELPLRNYSTSSDLPTIENFINITDIIRPLVFSASSNQTAVAGVSVISNDLFVQGFSPGTATITVTATDANGATASQSFEVAVQATPVHAANISTRLQVGAGEDALIGGFIILGDAPKRVMIRAIGPSLEGVNGTLSNPNLELHDSTGALIASNDDWQNAPNKRDIMNSGFAPTDPAEAAILTTLDANSSGTGYTAVVHSADGTSGVGLVEVYDLDSGPGASVLNISTRGNVQTGDNVMIGGFIISGDGTQRVLVRAIGPSLAGGVSDPLADPTLALFDSQGTQIDFNDDWQDSPVAGEIEDTTIPPTDPSESAVLQTLVPGAYTAILAGFDNTTGTGLLEVYALIN